MGHPAGEAQFDALRVDSGWRLKLGSPGSSVSSDTGLLACRELEDALGPMAIPRHRLVDRRTGRNGHRDTVGMAGKKIKSGKRAWHYRCGPHMRTAQCRKGSGPLRQVA